MQEKLIGKITHFYGHLSVGIIQLSDELNVGDTVHIKGHTSDFTQEVPSIQIEHKDVNQANTGDLVGIKVSQKVHEQDSVFKVIG